MKIARRKPVVRAVPTIAKLAMTMRVKMIKQ